MSSSTPTNPSRRKALQCMAFGGLGTLFTLSGGILTPFDLALAQTGDALPANAGRPLFVQISDTHIGFNKEANPDVSATLKQTIELRQRHAGDARAGHPYRRHHAPVQARGVRPRVATALRAARAGTAYGARRARRHRRFGRRIFRPVRQGVGQPRLLQLRSRGRALHRPRQRDALQAERPAASATTSSRGSRRISRAARRARRSSCSRTCRCGPSTSRGAGAPATRRRRWRCCAASARSPY